MTALHIIILLIKAYCGPAIPVQKKEWYQIYPEKYRYITNLKYVTKMTGETHMQKVFIL